MFDDVDSKTKLTSLKEPQLLEKLSRLESEILKIKQDIMTPSNEE